MATIIMTSGEKRDGIKVASNIHSVGGRRVATYTEDGVIYQDPSGAKLTEEELAEIIAAIEAADLESPEQVADLCIDVASDGGDWRAKLAACAAIG